MNALTTDRIRSHATRLGLTHLTETITALVERAETAQLGYLEFVDLLLGVVVDLPLGVASPRNDDCHFGRRVGYGSQRRVGIGSLHF